MKRVVVESPLAGIKKTQCRYCGDVNNGSDWCVAADGYCQPGPYGPPDFRRAIRYAQLCLLDCLNRGEAPFASHLLYPQVFDDRSGLERDLGIAAGLSWGLFADVCAVYEDFGVSPGMERGLARYESVGIPVERRKLPPELLARVGEDPAMWETLR